MMSCYPIGRFLLFTTLKLSNGILVAEKVPSVARLTYVDFSYTNSRAFQEPHRKQDARLRKRQSLFNLNVIIFKINKSSERFKLTGELRTWYTFKLRFMEKNCLYENIVDPFVHIRS